MGSREKDEMTDQRSADSAAPVAVPITATIVFVALAMGLAWLFALPLWVGDGLAEPFATPLMAGIMYTPALAVLFVIFVMRAVPKGQRLRFLGVWPLRPAGRVIGMSAVAVGGTIVVVAVAMLIAVLFGWFESDFAGLSGFRSLIESTLPAGVPMPPIAVLVTAQLVMIPVAAVTVNALAAFGEELGWRGFLVPALRPLGTWPALLISGAVWGLWHSPLILLGYNFGRADVVGVLLMTGACILWGVLLGWLRLRTGSVWPAVFAHGAMNASIGMPVLFLADGAAVDPMWASALGVSGWIVVAVVIAVLAVAGQFPRQPALAPRRQS